MDATSSTPPASEVSKSTPTLKPISLALPLPLSPQTTLHIQITRFATSTLILLTTRTPVDSATSSRLGSFIYAIPHRLPSNRGEPPLATPLVRQPGTQDFATRVGRAVAKRTGKPAHVGCSMVLAGSSVEEEAAALKAAVEAIMGALENDEAKVNGVKG